MGVEDGCAGDRGVAQLGEIGGLHVVAEGDVPRRAAGWSPAIVRNSVVLPAPLGPTMPIRSPRRAARNGLRATVTASLASEPSGRSAPRPGGSPAARSSSRMTSFARAGPRTRRGRCRAA